MERLVEAYGMRRAARMLGDVLFPPTCALCRSATARPHALCPCCWTKLRFIEAPFCAVLGTPFATEAGPGAVSPEAIADPPRFRRMRAAVAYDDAAGRLVSALKYGDRIDLAPMMATWMGRAGRELLAEADLVVPVPLHRFRLFTRRFNQSAELARAVARDAGVPYAPLDLVRSRWTSRQVGLGRESRRENVRGAFRVPDARRAAVAGRRILLVDDVFTTGATIEASTKALLKGGAASVDVLVFARVAASHRGVHMLVQKGFPRFPMADVTIYTRDFCGYCARAKQLLQKKDVAFEEKNATHAPELRAEMLSRANGRSTFPQIFIGETHVGGCDDLHALDGAGKLDPLLAA